MTQLNVLVTGGAGFIGSHLVDALINQGHKVRILDGLVEQVHLGKVPAFLNPKAEFLRGDICDTALLDRALDGIDVVSHQAAEVGVGQSMYEPVRYVRANTLGTTVLLEKLSERHRRQPFKKLIVASSMSIYGEGAYVCAKCGRVHPQLRPTSQLQAHEWEVKCPQCSAPLKPLATSEEKTALPDFCVCHLETRPGTTLPGDGTCVWNPDCGFALFQCLRRPPSAFKPLHRTLRDLQFTAT